MLGKQKVGERWQIVGLSQTDLGDGTIMQIPLVIDSPTEMAADEFLHGPHALDLLLRIATTLGPSDRLSPALHSEIVALLTLVGVT